MKEPVMDKKKSVLRVIIIVGLLLAFVMGMFAAAMAFAEELQLFKIELYKKLPWREEYARAQETAADYSAYPVMEQTDDAWYANARLIVHACGGIDGLDYTNSREAMDSTLKKGHRFVEVDFTFSSDGIPVCVHSWSDLNSDTVMDHNTFKSHKIYGKYSTLDAEDILDYMERFPDLYIVLDTKDSMPELVRALVDLNAPRDIMERFIIQVYAAGEKSRIMELYPFPEENFLFTAYILGNRPGYIMSVCYEENISVVTLPYEWLSDSWHYFFDKDFVVFIHTVNRPDEMKWLFSKGVHGVYTDFLSLTDLEL